MDERKFLKIIQDYERILETKGFSLEENNLAGTDQARICHVLWMCQKIREYQNICKTDKAHRWLGFVQGCFWSYNIFSIEELKKQNSLGAKTRAQKRPSPSHKTFDKSSEI